MREVGGFSGESGGVPSDTGKKLEKKHASRSSSRLEAEAASAEIADTVLIAAAQSVNDTTSDRVLLRAAEEKRAVGGRLRERFQLAPQLEGNLDRNQQEILQDTCIRKYSEAVKAFDLLYAKACSETPAVQATVKKMAHRMHHFIQAYTKLVSSQQHSSKRFQTPVEEKEWLLKNQEFLGMLDRAKHLGLSEACSGSVGSNPLAMGKVLDEGTIREQMTFIMAFDSFIKENYLFDKELLLRINDELAQLPSDERFQLNIPYIFAHRPPEGASYIFTGSELSASKYSRDAGGKPMRISRSKNEQAEYKKPLIRDFSDMTIREVRAILRDPISEETFAEMKAGKRPNLAEKVVSWVSGAQLSTMNANYEFVQRAEELGGLPVLTGPSGTTELFTHFAHMLEMRDQVPYLHAALVGWMIPTRDHSLHDICSIGPLNGLDYQGTPENFGPNDPYTLPEVQRELSRVLNDSGAEYPQYYLGSDYQMEVAQSRGWIDDRVDR